MTSHLHHKAALLLSALLLASCGPDTKPDEPVKPDPVDPKPSVIEVTSVSLSQTSASIQEGDKFSLAATVLPANATDKTVTWSSDNETVATVSGGTVNALSAGSATIKAAAGKKYAVCKITVTAKPKSASFVKSVYYCYPGMSFTPELVYEDGSIATASSWSVSGPEIMTVSEKGDVSVTACSKESATLTAVVGEQKLNATVWSNVKADFGFEWFPGDQATVSLASGSEPLKISFSYQDSENSFAAYEIETITVENPDIAEISRDGQGWLLRGKSLGDTSMQFTLGNQDQQVKISVTNTKQTEGPVTYEEDDYGTF